jgi:hypothetical protein
MCVSSSSLPTGTSTIGVVLGIMFLFMWVDMIDLVNDMSYHRKQSFSLFHGKLENKHTESDGPPLF